MEKCLQIRLLSVGCSVPASHAAQRSVLVLGTGGGTRVSPAVSKGLFCLIFDFKGFCFQALRKGQRMLLHVVASSSSFAITQKWEIKSTLRFWKIQPPCQKSRVNWSSCGRHKAFVKCLPISQVHRSLHLLFSKAFFWSGQKGSFTSRCLKKGKKCVEGCAMLSNSGFLLLATYNLSNIPKNIKGLLNGI